MTVSKRIKITLTAAVFFFGAGTFANTTAEEYQQIQEDRGVTYSNPIINTTGDPTALKHGKNYYIYLPENSNKSGNYKVYKSRNMTGWTYVGKLFDDSTFVKNSTHKNKLWAPDVYFHKENSKFYVYYTLVQDYNDTCMTNYGSFVGSKDIGVAVSDSPTGPFKPVMRDGKRVILAGGSNDCAYIDPNLFRDDDGTLYLVYKYRGKSGKSKIYMVQMKNPTTKLKNSRRLLMSNDSSDGWMTAHPNNRMTWEVLGGSPTIEQPYLTKAHGYYYLLYSGNQGETENYGIGAVRSTSLNSLFTKFHPFIDRPVVGKRIGSSDSNSIYGPGAVSIIKDSYNRRWLVYRQKNNSDHNWDRQTYIDRIEFTSSGMINVEPTKNTTEYAPVIGRETP